MIKIWDLGSGKVLHSSHAAKITSLDFSKNSTLLASGSLDGVIKLWDVQSASGNNDTNTGACLKTFYTKSTDVLAVKFSNRNMLYGMGSFR